MVQVVLTLLSLAIIIILTNSTNGDKVDEYVNLISNEVDKSFKFTLPVDNREFFYKADLNKNNLIDFGTYDFLVVGGGSAGAIVAKRLSEKKWKTLLIEAGDQESNFTEIPGTFRNLQNSTYNWGYLTKPQKYCCLGMINKQCAYPRGKSLGGSSTINAMVYARGNAHDQNKWSDFGITGWSWNECLPYYKRLENYQQVYGDEGYHGYNGPVTMDYSRPSSFLIRSFLNANAEIGQETKDYNGEFNIGAGKTQYTKKFGKRGSTNRYYLQDYNNYLSISTKSMVYKIIVNNNKRAIGVDFVKNYKMYRAFAKHEVILSAGSINTPQILMLSGIGPRNELLKHNIPLVEDLPVGRNMEDHIGFVGLQFKSSLSLFDSTKSLEEHVWEYLSATGRLTEPSLASLSFISTENNNTFPDVEIMLIPGKGVVPSGNIFRYTDDTLRSLPQYEPSDKMFSMIAMLLHPKSTGTVTLKSSNPQDFPIIDTNSLSDPHDVETIYKSVKYIMKLLDTDAFKKINVTLLQHNLPACKQFQFLSKDYWYCTISQLSHTIYHPTGTCRMGTNTDPLSVVDNRLRVYGVQRLRIVDLSVVPSTNSGHTNSLAMMIGEKGADIINQEYWFYNFYK